MILFRAEAILASSTSKFVAQGSRCSRAVCRLLLVCFPFVVVLSFVRERVPMPKGWTKAPVLDGWVQIVRGQVPKSEQWPNSKSGKKSQSRDTKVVPPFFPPRQPSRPPEQLVAEANEERFEVGGSSEGSWRREQRSREATCRIVEGRQSEVTSSPSDGEVGSLPELSQTSPKASRQSRRVDCQSHGANVTLRGGSARGRRTSAAIGGRSGKASTTFSANSHRVTEENRGIGARAG